jgi:hypothetical protein
MVTARIALILVGTITLGSCQSSFNHIEISNSTLVGMPGRAPAKASGAAIAQAALSSEKMRGFGDPRLGADPPAAGRDTPTCPIYRLPDLDPVPELPYNELKALEPGGNVEEFDRATRQQITDLRLYISNMKKRIRDSHQEYLKACQEYLSNAHQNSLGQ